MLKHALPLILGLVLNPAVTQAQDVTAGDLTIIHPVMRAPVANAKASGGYMVISNNGTTDDRLLKATADIGDPQLHKSEVGADGMAQMIPQQAVTVPAGGSVEFAPGGLHVMFVGLTAQPKPGDMVPVTLFFEKAGEVRIEFMVEDAKGMGDMDMKGMDMEGMDHSGHQMPMNSGAPASP